MKIIIYKKDQGAKLAHKKSKALDFNESLSKFPLKKSLVSRAHTVITLLLTQCLNTSVSVDCSGRSMLLRNGIVAMVPLLISNQIELIPSLTLLVL